MSWDGKIFEKYKIAHADGTPLKGKKYFVLRLDSDNPEEAARVNAAMAAYRGENVLNASVREMLWRVHTHLSQYVAHQITDTSLCLRVKNEINSYLANARQECGDDSEMREALEMALEELESHGCIEENYDTLGDVPCVRLHKKIRAVLAKK